MEKRREILNWDNVDNLIDHLIPQFDREFDAMMIITRGGIVPAGLLADALDVSYVLTASVDFPTQMEMKKAGLFAWPRFLQFPEDTLLYDRHMLVVDDVWGSGRVITSVKNRIKAAYGFPYTCVLHFNPYRSLFGALRPDFYAAITDAHIVYPWEIDRGVDRVLLDDRPHPSS